MSSASGIRTVVISGAVVFVITLPFTGIAAAAALGVAAALYQSFNEGLFHRGDAKPVRAPHRGAGLGEFLRRPVLTRWSPAAAATLFVALPFLLNRYQVEIVTLALIYVVLSVGLNYVVGLSGLLVLGYIAYYAVGAYTYALLNTHFHLNYFLVLPLGLGVGALAGVLTGLPVLRLRGDYLAIVTLGFGEITRIILNNWDELTAGPNGVMGIARPDLWGLNLGTAQGYYFLALLLAAAGAAVQVRLTDSRVGRAWDAIREDELAAAHSGVPVVRMKLLSMAVAGAYAGAAGTLFAARMTHVSPESFTFLESVLVLCMVVLGGMGSVTGVTVGALALIIVPELLRGIANYRMLAFGLLMVLTMRYRRTGLIPGRRFKVTTGST